MSILFNANARLRSVQRAGAKDRYGQPTFETPYSMVDCRLDRSTKHTQTSEGVLLVKDASAWIESRYALKVQDVLTVDVDEDERYNVIDVQEKLDLLGNVDHRVYGLTRRS